jgi:sugar lactone lactonase YvrE
MKYLLAAILTLATLATAKPIQHEFVVFDEAGHQLVHIDEKDASKNWKLHLDGKCWDIQLAGDNQLLLATPTGYHLVDLASGELVETVKIDGLKDAWSFRRLEDGSAVAIGLRGKQSPLFAAEISKNGEVLRKAEVPGAKNLRFGRVTADGHALTVPEDELIEWDLDGNIIKRFPLPQDVVREKGLKAFMALKDSDGCYWVAYGYGAITVKLSPEGEVLQKFIGPEGTHFTAGFQRLPNGNLVQANWAGHKPEAAVNGKQLVEFNPQGEVVWTYHNPEEFYCPVSVIILDDLNTKKPAGDQSGTLKNF